MVADIKEEVKQVMMRCPVSQSIHYSSLRCFVVLSRKRQLLFFILSDLSLYFITGYANINNNNGKFLFSFFSSQQRTPGPTQA